MPSAPSREGHEFSANVRMGELETLKEAGSRGAGLRVLIGKRMGASYTSDLTPEASGRWCGRRSILRGLRPKIRMRACPILRIGIDSVADLKSISPRRRNSSRRNGRSIREARRSRGARVRSADHQLGRRLLRFEYRRPCFRQFARILRGLPFHLLFGFGRSRRQDERQSMERDYWFTMARNFTGLEEPEYVGRRRRRARACGGSAR